jgi:hypothetical protein
MRFVMIRFSLLSLLLPGGAFSVLERFGVLS